MINEDAIVSLSAFNNARAYYPFGVYMKEGKYYDWGDTQDEPLALLEEEVVKCSHCGQYGLPKSVCQYCGAGIDADG